MEHIFQLVQPHRSHGAVSIILDTGEMILGMVLNSFLLRKISISLSGQKGPYTSEEMLGRVSEEIS